MSGGAEMDSHSQHTAGAYAPYLPEVTRRARLAVARRATDPDDCAELLKMLDLAEDPS